MQNNWINLLKELESTNSNKVKETILAKYKNDKLVQKMLVYALDPYVLFYVKKLPKLTPTINISSRPMHLDVIDLLEDLTNRVVTGNAALDKVKAVFNRMDADELNAYKKVLLKSAIGAGPSTVNKVWPDLVPTFEVMLAPSKLTDLGKVKFPVMVQPKLDGFRTVYLPYTEPQNLWARSGLPHPNVQLKDYFTALYAVSDYVLDGEIYNHSISFNKLQSMLNSEDEPIHPATKFVIYDAIPVADWKAAKTKLTYDKRLKTVRELVQSTISDRKKVLDIESTICNSAKEVLNLYKQYLKDDYEGVMLKAPLGYYQWKRVTLNSGEMTKLKPFDTIDLIVTGVYEGEQGSKYEGTLGGLDLDYNGTTVSCGSGLDDAMRKTIWANPNGIIGKTVEIKYFEITEDNSLRFPIFVRIREDK